MIYDTFLYNGEKEMLELRMKVLRGVVSKFLPITGKRNFRGREQHPYGSSVGARWCELPSFTNPWIAEQWQRNEAIHALFRLQPEDIVLIGDVDEIPDPANVNKIGGHVMMNYCCNFRRMKMPRIGTVGVSGKTLLDGVPPHEIRRTRYNLPQVLSGAHLCNFFMTPEDISRKIQSYSHYEFDTPEFTDPEKIAGRIKAGVDLFDRKDEEEAIVTWATPQIPLFLRAALEGLPANLQQAVCG